MTLQTDFACIGDLTAYLLELAKPPVRVSERKAQETAKPGESVFIENRETNTFGFLSKREEIKVKNAPAGGALDKYDFGELDAAELRNEALAAIVKEERAKGRTLDEIAIFTGSKLSSVKKISAALSKAAVSRAKPVRFGSNG